MTDGAHLGVGPTRALRTILGGEDQPTDDEKMSADEMREWLLSAPRCTDPEAVHDYDACTLSLAGEVLRWALAHPSEYAHASVDDLYDIIKQDGVHLEVLDVTGFMWGWAYNAVARCLELPPAPNPAILTLDVSDSDTERQGS